MTTDVGAFGASSRVFENPLRKKKKHDFDFALFDYVLFNDFEISEESNKDVAIALYKCYNCFVKLKFKPFGTFSMVLRKIKVEDSQVFEFALFSKLSLNDFGVLEGS